MVVIGAAVLVIMAQAFAAEASKDEAAVARRRTTALSEAQAQADDAVQKALAALEQSRMETAEQLAACQESAEQAEAAARAARTELEQVRDVAAKTISDVQQAVQIAIQQAITDWDPILAERVTGPGQPIERVKDDAEGQVNAVRTPADAAEAVNEHLGKTVELVDARGAENPEQKDDAMVTQQLARSETATARRHGVPPRRTSKMTPLLVDKAQRMYDSGDYTVADIAESFDVSPTTIYRYLRTRPAT